MGRKFFDALTRKYIELYPSRSSSLDDYGAQLPEFVASFPPLEDINYASDLARLEWYWHKAFHAKDQRPLDMTRLLELSATDDVDGLQLKLFESAFLMSSERSGSNLRNRMAHGLINDDEFCGSLMSYLGWLVLRLCWLPILQYSADRFGSRAMMMQPDLQITVTRLREDLLKDKR